MSTSSSQTEFYSTNPASGLEYLYWNDTLLATILYSTYRDDGISFFTPPSFSQQLGYMNRESGYRIPPHDHNEVPRNIVWTQETLFIRSGKVRADFYAPDSRKYLGSRILSAGDVILLAHGGHGFEILEAADIIEVKQGPYSENADKTRFQPDSGPMANGVGNE